MSEHIEQGRGEEVLCNCPKFSYPHKHDERCVWDMPSKPPQDSRVCEVRLSREQFHKIMCEHTPTIAEDSGLPEWSKGELDEAYDALTQAKFATKAQPGVKEICDALEDLLRCCCVAFDKDYTGTDKALGDRHHAKSTKFVNAIRKVEKIFKSLKEAKNGNARDRHDAEEGGGVKDDAMDAYINGIFITNTVEIKTWKQRIWGAWQCLNGNCITMFVARSINYKKFYK